MYIACVSPVCVQFHSLLGIFTSRVSFMLNSKVEVILLLTKIGPDLERPDFTCKNRFLVSFIANNSIRCSSRNCLQYLNTILNRVTTTVNQNHKTIII